MVIMGNKQTQGQSVLSSGSWVKLGVSSSGVYKFTFADLQSFGIDPTSIDPATLRIFGNGGGMLPQANSATRPNDLEEMAIKVVGEEDGSFDTNDYLLFFADGADLIWYDTLANSFEYQHHSFTDTNYYFLNYNQSQGKRILDSAIMSSGSSFVTAYKIYSHETDQTNILHSGRQWFGEKFDIETVQTFNTGVKNIADGSIIKIISSVMSTSLQPANFKLQLNGIEIGNQAIAANPNGTYATKGTVALDTFNILKSNISSDPLELTYTFEKDFGIGYLDYFLIQTTNNLLYEGEPLYFYTGELVSQGNKTFLINNCPEGLTLWDISDHNKTSNIPYTQSGNTISFNANNKNLRFVLFNDSGLQNKPISNQYIANQNLHAITNVDLLIVAPDIFLSQANFIANLRASEGITAIVATPEQIFNEFSSGKPDITAIRDFARLLYNNAGLRYLLMFGKGTFDPKDVLQSDLQKLPIYESRNSLQPLATYGSDDYLGFLEDNEGEWTESSAGDHTLDIGIGRIPAATPEEADNYIYKLSTYKEQQTIGPWRKNVVFVAENGDQNIHQRDAERLATLIDTTYANFNTNKVYIDAYPIEVNPGNKRAPMVNQVIYDKIQSGTLIMNYTGHGNEIQWANTRVFDKNVIDTLTNDYVLPLFVTATCEFGRHDDTSERSGGEELLVKKKTGAIAMITTARPVFSSSNYQLNLAFYKQVFEKPNGDFQRLGDIIKKTKNNSLNGVLNRNFSLLGDPSMKLSYPNQTISLNSLNGKPISTTDTLSALVELTFSGSVRNANQSIDDLFNGDLEVLILDKTKSKKTLGNLGDTPFTYKVRDNTLFKGLVTVEKGNFSFTTVLPKDISYKPGRAKITFYAQNNDSTNDAGGASIDFLIGSSTSDPIIDNIPPKIKLFLGDTSFIPGLTVNPNTLLIAKINDDYGINTSNTQVGHSITYILDDNEPINLNTYYSSKKDDFTEGWIYYNLPELSPGNHVIDFTAWDTSNNTTTTSIVFEVAENGQVVISDLSNYPNPMKESTTFTFAHNLAGDEVEVTLEIINTAGQKIYRQKRNYISAPSVIDNWLWNGRNANGGKLPPGIYIYGIIIRSKNSNLSQKQYSRLFITN